METRRPIAIGTTVLGLLAIAATAGIYGERSTGFGGGPTVTGGAEGDPSTAGLPAWVIENFFAAILTLSALLLVLGATYLLVFRGRQGLRDVGRFLATTAAWAAGGVVLFFGAKALLVYFSTGEFQVPGGGGGASDGGSAGAGGVGGPGGADGSIPAIYITIAVIAIAAVFLYFMFQRKGSGTAGAAGGTGPPPAAEATDAAATEPAVCIEDVPTSNAVYRAWRDMATRAVEASDRTATASDVAGAAVRSGFDREAVGTITELFEEVRYGDRPVTDERERRAKAALESLEDAGEAGS